MNTDHEVSDDVIRQILSARLESVPQLISELCNRHELSRVMHELNARLMSDDQKARASAQKALDRMGFI